MDGSPWRSDALCILRAEETARKILGGPEWLRMTARLIDEAEVLHISHHFAVMAAHFCGMDGPYPSFYELGFCERVAKKLRYFCGQFEEREALLFSLRERLQQSSGARLRAILDAVEAMSCDAAAVMNSFHFTAVS
ncbi:MAG: hypothetical protein J5J00_16275 [Deltaproteobacteria bacterium]|nr:hypothetical protein [Deltaproteobacteria bacterium]